MFDSRFNNNFQNTVPNENTDLNPYQGMSNQNLNPYQDMSSQNNQTSWNQPQPMQSNMFANNPENVNYAEGGEVKKGKKTERMNPYPSLAEMIRQQGKGEDMILAHINPLEAMMLQQMGGSGTINPKTGLPQFGFFNKPWKWLKSNLGGAGGAILGNMILPGLGGIIGGGLGGAAGSAVRGRKDYLQAGLRGASIGAALPTAASLLGSGASKLGMSSAGSFLSDYGAKNSILASLGLGGSAVPGVGSGGVSAGGGGGALSNAITGTNSGLSASAGASGASNIGTLGEAAKGSWYDKWLEPQNLMTAVALGGSFMNRPKKRKEKSPEQLANEAKRLYNGVRLNRGEIEADEAAEFLKKQANYRLRHNLAGGESLAAAPVYRKVNSPEEYKKKGKWLEYHDNPGFTGNPLLMKMGGKVPEMQFEEEEVQYPSGLGRYIQGQTGGQDDKIPAELSDGEYVIPADVVSHQGDGNNAAGAKKFDEYIKDIRKDKGGGIHLPPKAKPLASYMVR